MLQKHLKGHSPNALEGKTGYYLYHLLDSSKKWFDLPYPVISTMRHPVRILESHRRRGEDLPMVEEQFRNFEKLKDPIIIHVDRQNRDEYLARASKRLGLDLTTDWPLLSSKGTLTFKVTPERLKEIPEWIMQIYKSTL